MALADILEQSGDKAAARAELERVVEIEPENLGAISKLAQMCLQQRDFAAARDLFHQAAQLVPDKPGPHLGCGVACSQLGDHRAAIESFTEAQKLSPQFSSVTLRIVDEHMALQEPEEALRILRQAAKRTRNGAVVHKRIGDIYLSLGRYTHAVEEYRAAVLHKPESVEQDPELRTLLEAGGNPEPLARQVQAKLAVLVDEPEIDVASLGLGRQDRFARFRGRFSELEVG